MTWAARASRGELTQSCPMRRRRPHLPWPMRARCRSTPGTKVDPFVPPCRGVFDGIPLPPAGPAAGSRSAARETRTPQCESLSRGVPFVWRSWTSRRRQPLRSDGTQPTDFAVEPASPFDGRMSSPDQDPRGVNAGGRRATFRSTTRGEDEGRGINGASPLARSGRSRDRPSGARRPFSQHPGEGCGETSNDAVPRQVSSTRRADPVKLLPFIH